MRRNSTIKFVTLLCALLLIASIGGVYATWSYARGDVMAEYRGLWIALGEFVWEPEEILPTETPGENYIELLGSILENNKGGLNSNKDTLEDAVLKYHIVHCEQNVTGGNLKHLKDLFTTNSQELDFVVQYISDEEFHLYMFETDDVEHGTVNVTQVKVYKTILLFENNKWAASEAQFGYATLRYITDTDYVAINPYEWVKGPMPEEILN